MTPRTVSRRSIVLAAELGFLVGLAIFLPLFHHLATKG